MGLTIRNIQVTRIRRPLKQPFQTHLQHVRERESLIVSADNREGQTGYGECVAFSTPWYTAETVTSCLFVLQEVLIPLFEGKNFGHPAEVYPALSQVKGNRMAKAAIETAIWDLFAKAAGQPLWQMVGGTDKPVSAGVVVAAEAGKFEEEVRQAAATGYRRVKVKISRQSDPISLKALISHYPNQLFFGDANGAFSAGDLKELAAFDDCGFTLIEQPFGVAEWALHAEANRQLKTPICLDESIASFEDAKRMIETEAGSIAVLKMGRLGGWQETLRVYELFRSHDIRMWVGGMIEFGVSKAHNLALASLPGIDLPGDFSASRHFWERDIISPDIRITNGEIRLSPQPGIGYDVSI